MAYFDINVSKNDFLLYAYLYFSIGKKKKAKPSTTQSTSGTYNDNQSFELCSFYMNGKIIVKMHKPKVKVTWVIRFTSKILFKN